MHHERIKRRLDAIAASIPKPMPKVVILLVWPDGHCSHDATDYASVDEALEILRPEEHIVVQVEDMSKPAQKAKE